MNNLLKEVGKCFKLTSFTDEFYMVTPTLQQWRYTKILDVISAPADSIEYP